MSRNTAMKRGGMVLLMTLFWTSATSAQHTGVPMGSHSALGHSGQGVLLVGDVALDVQAPAPWLQEDPGARAYARAREYLNASQYREAADAFYQLRRQYAESVYAADSYYWQAFSLYRLGSRSQLREARELLRTMRAEHRSANTLADAEELLVSVESRLAQQGDAQAAASITQQATDPCGPEQETRLAALQALMNMNPDRALPILREVLQDRDACSAELREHAVFLIAQSMDEDAVDILMDLAHRNPDPDPEVREQAVFWMSQVDTPEALEALESILLEANDAELQENALFAISQHQSERSGQVLRRYAERSDISTELRENAIFWIGHSPGGGQYLMTLWDTLDDPELKENALHAIAQAGGAASRDWLVGRAMDSSEDVEVRQNAIFWAGQTGAFGIGELRELFDSFSDPEMKEQVLFAASQRDEPEAVDFLMEVAEDADNGELREQAIFWLGQSDDPRVPDFLLRIIGR